MDLGNILRSILGLPNPNQNILTPFTERQLAGNPNHLILGATQHPIVGTPAPQAEPDINTDVATLHAQLNNPQTGAVMSQISQPQSPTLSASTPTQPQIDSSSLNMPRNPDVLKGRFGISQPVKSAIQTASKQFSVPEGFLSDLFAAESSFNPSLVNNTPAGVAAGHPTGLGQFTDSTWNDLVNGTGSYGQSLRQVIKNKDRTDPTTNALATAYLISSGQLGRWNASEGNWGNFWTPQELEKLGFYSQDPTHVTGKRYSQLSQVK